MDFNGEPSQYLEYDVDVCRPSSMSLRRSASFPRWNSLWNHQRFEVDASLLIGCEDDFIFAAARGCEARTKLAGPGTTERQMHQQRQQHGIKPVRCETWTHMPTTRCGDDSQPQRSVDQQQPSSDATAESRVVATFSAGDDELTAEPQNVISHTWTSEPPTESDKLSCRQDRRLNLRDLVTADSGEHSIILSAIRTFDQLMLGARRNPEVASCTDPASVQTAASRHSERSTLFGLPGRVTVSMRELNMMTPISF